MYNVDIVDDDVRLSYSCCIADQMYKVNIFYPSSNI